MTNPTVDRDGSQYWRDEYGNLHREDGPAVIDIPGGETQWYIHGVWHREDGPAIERANGTRYWLQRNRLHRVGAPAIIYSNNQEVWYVNGKLHREDGPAITGSVYWYLNNVQMTFDEYCCQLNLTPQEKLALAIKFGVVQ